MNYYQFHIGDYIKQTVHLTPMEDLCYRRLIDFYYETERPIPTKTDLVSRRLRLDTELVDSVLKEFFVLTDNGWENARCNKEIDIYHNKADAARSNGKLGGRPKKTQPVPDRNPQESESKANHKPITTNHEPVNPLSDKSDGVRLANGKQKFKDDAIQVLEFLNQKTGKHYRPLKANLDLIAARLAEGAQVSDCRAVIARQSRKWMGTDSEIYLRPATLFNATKFAQYTGEIGND